MRSSTPLSVLLALGVLLVAACNTPRDAARSDTAAGGSPTAKLDSTSNPATIDGKTADSTRPASAADSAAGHGSGHP